MRRREFITLVGGAAAAWPLAARAQQERIRRIGVLQALDADDPIAKSSIAAFTHGLQESGWTEGRNLRIDQRWAAGNIARLMADAAELVRRGGLARTDGGAAGNPHHTNRVYQRRRSRRPGIHVVYPFRDFVADGGLISYGNNVSENYRQAAGYVDRILRGANPADLPVQAPTKFELIINLNTAKALGLDVPLQLQQLADEVIE
jgi:ABC transporter substrate binding protein